MLANQRTSGPIGSVGSKAVLFIFLLAAVGHGSFIALNQVMDIPHIDDWRFVSELADIDHGSTGMDYLLARHNRHPVMPARAAFLLCLKFSDLDLRLIRYGTYGVALACFALLASLSAVAWRAVDQGESDPAPILSLLIAFIALTVFSANHWESYSLAMGITNMTCTTAVVASVLCGYGWLRRRGEGRWLLLMAFVSGLIASVSMTQGMFVWSSLACLFLLGTEPRRLRLGLACLGLQALFLLWNSTVHEGVEGSLGTFKPARLLVAMPMLVGTPFFGMINNAFHQTISASGGLVLSGLALLGVLSRCRPSRQDFTALAPFLALLLYGAFTIVLIAIGRQALPLETMASPRYAALTMPFMIGAFGCTCIAARTSRLGVGAAGGMFAVCLLGWLIAGQQESVMIKYRREARQEIRRFLLDTSPDEMVLQGAQQKLYVNDATLKDVLRAVTFLRARKLSMFADKPVQEPVSLPDLPAEPEMTP